MEKLVDVYCERKNGKVEIVTSVVTKPLKSNFVVWFCAKRLGIFVHHVGGELTWGMKIQNDEIKLETVNDHSRVISNFELEITQHLAAQVISGYYKTKLKWLGSFSSTLTFEENLCRTSACLWYFSTLYQCNIQFLVAFSFLSILRSPQLLPRFCSDYFLYFWRHALLDREPHFFNIVAQLNVF